MKKWLLMAVLSLSVAGCQWFKSESPADEGADAGAGAEEGAEADESTTSEEDGAKDEES